MAHKSIKKALLSLSVAAALGCSTGGLLADGNTRVEELEARVAELEALVTQLLVNQQETAVVDVVVAEEAAEEVAEAKVTEMEKFIKKVENLQKKAITQISKDESAPVQGKEQLRYIG